MLTDQHGRHPSSGRFAMQTQDLAMEANACRALASQSAGKAEQSVLLNLARAFDQLALARPTADCPTVGSASNRPGAEDSPAGG